MSMMNKFSFGFRPFNFTNDPALYHFLKDEIILCIFFMFICIFGLIGNGIFLWLLTFNIKRNAFVTYLLNLSVASIGLLLVLFHAYVYIFIYDIGVRIDIPYYVYAFFHQLLLLTHNSGQFILTVISIDRCVSVLYPNWYLCHKSPNFTIFVCFLIWVLSFLIFGIHLTIEINGILDSYYDILSVCWLVGPFLICLLVVTASTLTLFVKVCFQSQPQQRSALVTVILLTLLLFLLVDAFVIIVLFHSDTNRKFLYTFSGCSLVNSINPLIYFLVGRWKGSHLQESMRLILQRVFKEEEPPLPNHTQLQSLH